MKFSLSTQLLAASLPVTLAGSGGLRYLQSNGTTPTAAPAEEDNVNVIPNTPGFNYHAALSQEEWTVFPDAGRIKVLDPSTISNLTLGFGYLELFPGGIREIHWHPFSTEWGYITEGECRFTLMDNEGNYENGYAKKGTIWNFPTSYAHSIQGVHPEDGCKMALFFDAPYSPIVNDISISQMMTAFPRDVLVENLGAPSEVIGTFYQKGYSVSPGPFPPPPFPESVKPLTASPTFDVTNGTCADVGDGAYLYMVRNDIFPGATTMSGGYMHLEDGTLRDIHWHPNANEMHYIISGTLKVGIYAMEDTTITYTLNAGDLGFVPRGMSHYFEAVDGPVDLMLAFDNPYWTTQELSTMFSVIPSYITAASINTTTEIVEEYFPKTEQEFFGNRFVGCPSVGTINVTPNKKKKGH